MNITNSAEVRARARERTHVYGEYFGAGWEESRYEIIGLRANKPDLWANEAGLYKTKWFDYRELHFIEAVYLFAELYSRACVKASSTKLGEAGKFKLGYSGNDIFKNKSKVETVGMWKARQMADELSIPYDFYNEFAMKWAEKNLWKRPPRPTP